MALLMLAVWWADPAMVTPRPARDDAELRQWLASMLGPHQYTPAEAGAALGLTAEQVAAAVQRLNVAPQLPATKLAMLPYPGGRHPRTGFRDGAVDPHRETKVSVFPPWANGGYAVMDVPEAVWFEPAPKKPELLYLAHTHVPTHWDRRKVVLPAMEWTRKPDGSVALERTLPDQTTLAATAALAPDGVQMTFRVTNNGKQPLAGLRVQMCAMLARLTGFAKQTNDNKVFAAPFAACRDESGGRWIVVGWEHCGRAWGNPPCPCLHADPVVPDCPPGESRTVRGWLSFHTGPKIDDELARLKRVAFP